jgi:hypothetical protein
VEAARRAIPFEDQVILTFATGCYLFIGRLVQLAADSRSFSVDYTMRRILLDVQDLIPPFHDKQSMFILLTCALESQPLHQSSGWLETSPLGWR